MTREIRQRVTHVLPVTRYRILESPEATPVPSVCREILEVGVVTLGRQCTWEVA
jgi:hypothetical protein